MRRSNLRTVVAGATAGTLALVWLASSPAQSASVYPEKDANLLITRDVAARLEAAGVRVVVTRSTDATVPLGVRTALANARHADAFVSIHNNAGVRGANWSEVYRQVVERPGSGALASSLALGLRTEFAGQRGVRLFARSGRDRDYYFVLRNTTMPAALVEGAFMSTPSEAGELARGGALRSRVASGIAAGILEYQRGLAPPVPPTAAAGERVQVDALPVPAEVDAVASSAWQVSLRWTASPLARQYRVYRDGQLLAVLDNPGFGSVTASLPPPLRFHDRWVGPGQQYRYEIRATEVAGAGRVVESSPAVTGARTPAILVVLDPGHGGADPGALGRY